jgi:hypothetical protein
VGLGFSARFGASCIQGCLYLLINYKSIVEKKMGNCKSNQENDKS